MPTRTILEAFDVSLDFLSDVVFANPSLRGMILGYLAEAKLRDILSSHGKATDFDKHDDHDRKKKGDLVLNYGGQTFKIEVKTLDTNHVELWVPDPQGATGGRWVRRMQKQKGPGTPNTDYELLWQQHRATGRFQGKFQCNASDKRAVAFPDQSKLETNLLLFGEFDILAVGLFPFREQWEFAFPLNRDLPQSTFTKYTPEQQVLLISSGIPITWPLAPPFTSDLYGLLDQLIKEGPVSANLPPATPTPKKRKKKS